MLEGVSLLDGGGGGGGRDLYWASFLSFFSSAKSSAPSALSRRRLRARRHCLGAGSGSMPSTL